MTNQKYKCLTTVEGVTVMVSDEDLRVNDWYWISGNIYQVDEFRPHQSSQCKRIIAATKPYGDLPVIVMPNENVDLLNELEASIHQVFGWTSFIYGIFERLKKPHSNPNTFTHEEMLKAMGKAIERYKKGLTPYTMGNIIQSLRPQPQYISLDPSSLKRGGTIYLKMENLIYEK